MDCTDDGKDTCGRFGVSGYPTLKIFKGGEMSSDYNGPREASKLAKFFSALVSKNYLLILPSDRVHVEVGTVWSASSKKRKAYCGAGRVELGKGFGGRKCDGCNYCIEVHAI